MASGRRWQSLTAQRQSVVTARAPATLRRDAFTTASEAPWPPRTALANYEPTSAIRDAYEANVWVYGCVRAICDALSGLSFVTGPRLHDYSLLRPSSALARLLGPPPGSPNPDLSARRLWAHAIASYVVTGQFGWEVSGGGSAVWPLPSSALKPNPGKTSYFDSLSVKDGKGQRTLQKGSYVYVWRPSLGDIRKPESALSAAHLDVDVSLMQDRYDYAFLKNDSRPASVIVHEAFAEVAERDAFRSQFTATFGGVANAGKPVFVEAEGGEGTAGAVDIKPVGISQKDSESIARSRAKALAICAALGVPFSRLDSSERTYCVDTETEILTRRGWLRHDEVTTDDVALTLNRTTTMAEWQPVLAATTFPGPHEVYELRSSGHSSVSTSEHRWLTQRHADPGLRWTMTGDMRNYDRVMAAAPLAETVDTPKWSDELVELVAWYYTEGWRSPFDNVCITQSERVNPENCARIRALLHRMFGPPRVARGLGGWIERAGREDTERGITRFFLGSDLNDALFAAAPDKVPRTEWLCQLTTAQLQLFIDTSVTADGSVMSQYQTPTFAQKDRRRTEAFQTACVLAGRASTVHPQKSGMWWTSVCKSPWRNPVGKRPKVKTVIDGPVWCPTTANGTWMARREGTTYFTGNSNAETEDRTFWEARLLPLVGELEDEVNAQLAPLVGPEVGWFDLRSVRVLRQSRRLDSEDLPRLIEAGIITVDEARDALGIGDETTTRSIRAVS